MRLAILLCPYIIARARAVSPLLFLSSVLTPCLIQTYTCDQTPELKQAYTTIMPVNICFVNYSIHIILYYSAIKTAPECHCPAEFNSSPEQTSKDLQGQLELNSAG